MKLSDLKTGEKGIIVKVLGHGGFRKRIIEMGFIKGKEVEVLLNAPLQDPVKYKLMGYEVSLRHHEAEMIEVIDSGQLKVDSYDYSHDEQGNHISPLSTLSFPLPSPRTQGCCKSAWRLSWGRLRPEPV